MSASAVLCLWWQALEMVLPEHRNGDWHFCRGMLNSETATFRMYDDLSKCCWAWGGGVG